MAQKKTPERVFSKKTLSKSARYRNNADAVNAVLEDGKLYSFKETDRLIENFLQRKVS